MPNRNSATAADLERFESEGYVILYGVLSQSVVEDVKREMQQIVEQQARKLLAEGKIQDSQPDEPFETRLAKLYSTCMESAPLSFRGDLLHRPGMFGMFFNPTLLDLVERILGPEIRIYPNYTVRPKLPDHAGTQVLWHQDAGYTEPIKTQEGVDQLRMVNVWSPLVPARVDNGCMQFVPRTHRLGVVPHVEQKYYLEIVRERLEPYLPQAVNIELDPGDIVLFSNLLFHAGLPNRSRTIRWSVDWRYQDARQGTLRPQDGHIARSAREPRAAVADGEGWASLEAGFK